MNLERLPEIVKAVKPTMTYDTHPFVLTAYHRPDYAWLYSYEWIPVGNGRAVWECIPHDAANACVVAMLGRLVHDYAREFDTFVVKVLDPEEPTPTYRVYRFPGDLLNALYDAFLARPEWFKEQA